MKIYTSPQKRCNDGIIAIQPDGYRISGIVTKPNGSSSNYLSVGRPAKKTDEFGDIYEIWEHHGYPNKCEELKVKREYDGKFGSSQTLIYWTIIAPQSFLDKGFAIAICGSGIGGSGHRSRDIKIFFDAQRIEEGTDVIRP